MAVSVASDKSLAISSSSLRFMLGPVGVAVSTTVADDDEGEVVLSGTRRSMKNSSPAATIESGLRISCDTNRTKACFWESIRSLECASALEMRPGMMIMGTTNTICASTNGQSLPSVASRHSNKPS